MDVLEAIDERTSVRSYTGEEILRDNLELMLKAAREAPSAKNLQPWKMIVVTDKRTLKELVPMCHNQAFIADAGAFVIGITEDEKWARLDLAIALDHLSLAAVALELGTCWIGAFDGEALRDKFGIPEEYEVTICMTVGRPGVRSDPPVKKSLEEMVCWERFYERG